MQSRDVRMITPVTARTAAIRTLLRAAQGKVTGNFEYFSFSRRLTIDGMRARLQSIIFFIAV